MKNFQIQTSQVKKKNRKAFWLLIISIVFACFFFAYSQKKEIEKYRYIEPISKKENTIQIPNISKYEYSKREVDWNKISAKSVYAFNPATGKIYYSKDINTKRPIASITKLMTAYTAISEYELSKNISVSKQLPSIDLPIGLKIGDEIQVNELIECMLIGSKNDCANTFSQDLKFISKMNDYAKSIGMKDSNFSNTTGYINTNNYSTAYDLGLLASAISRNSNLVKITDSTKAIINIEGVNPRNKNVNTTNVMLYENNKIKGLKTGFTYASGECLVLYYDYGGSNKLITIVLDSKDRFSDSRLLYNLIVNSFN